MDESDFEATLILEKLAEIGKVDEFFEAIDSDNLGEIRKILRRIHLDQASIEDVLKQIMTSQDS